MLYSVACSEFILAGAEKNIRWGRITPEGREIFFCPPGRIRFSPGAEQASESGRII